MRRKPAGRPPLPPGEARQDITLRLHPRTLSQLEMLSDHYNLPRARVIERAVAELYGGTHDLD